MNLEVAVCLPRDSETIGLARQVVADALRSFGVTRRCIEEIRLALSEACTNVIEHSGTDDEYEVRVNVDEQHSTIRVTQVGAAFDATLLADATPDENSWRGRGVGIMRALMDHVEFVPEPESGMTVHLVKTLSVEPHGLLARLRAANRPPDPQ